MPDENMDDISMVDGELAIDSDDITYDDLSDYTLESDSTALDKMYSDELSEEDISNAIEGSIKKGKNEKAVELWNPVGNNEVLGLPMYFNDLADPSGRIYNQTFLRDFSILNLIPGKPSFNKKLVDREGKKITTKELSRRLYAMDNDDQSSFSIAARGVAGYADLRYMGFKPAYKDYFDYVSVLLSAVHSMMGLGGIFRFSNEYKSNWTKYGLTYFYDRSTSISESANNDYGQSRIVDAVNQKSASARELRMVAGKQANIQEFTATSASDMADTIKSSSGWLSRSFSAFFRVVNGSQLLYPEVWQDSKFERSYNISFKFYSPYGDKESIFKYVYVPFITLLALALP